MRIKRQFIFSIVIFAIAGLVVSASLVVKNSQLSEINEQRQAANKIQIGVNDLRYLTDNFFLYQEDAKLIEWRTTLIAVYNEILKLNSTNLQQQTYVNNIKNDLGDIALSYNDLVIYLWNSPRNFSVRATPEFQEAWNQASEQYRALDTDSALLITFLADQATQARSNIEILFQVVLGLFGAYFLINYLIIYRRTIRSILGLKDATAIVGSGNLDYQIKVIQKNEIGELAVAFNQMTSHLKSVTASKTELDQEISDRKKEEIKLRESEEKFKAYVENSPVGIFVANNEGQYIYVNQAATKLLGYTEQELLKMHVTDIVFDQDLAATVSDFVSVKETGILCKQYRFKAKGDKEVFVILNAVALQNGKLLAFCENVSSLKKAEEEVRKSQRELMILNEKLRVVGGLSRHDVRNKLSAVTGYAYLLKKKHADEADVVEGLSKMETAVAESMKIFEFAKMYEQLGSEKLVEVDVEAKINEAAALFSGSLPKIINECHALTVLADSFLRQMFYNFMDNTRKYGKKTTTIKVHCHKTDEGNLLLIYEDDGVGISAENKLKLFSEGFSTGGSTGFGLFLTKKMIEVYGWNITEEGEQGKGAKFVITIPNHNKEGKENYQILPIIE